MSQARRDENYVPVMQGVDVSTLTIPTPLVVDEATGRLLVTAVITSGGGGGGGDGSLLDGVDTAIKATVFDLTSSNPLATQIVDASGVAITSFGGGTQYTDGDADATPTGTVALGFDGTNVQALSTDSSGNLQVDVLTLPAITAVDLDIRNLDSATDSITVAGTVAISGSVAVTGTFWQATQPVSATDLDIRNLVFATDKVDISGSTLGANSGVDIGDVTINNASIAVTGTFWQATQPVSIASSVAVTDNAGSLTVDAPVGTPVFVRLSDGAAAITTLPVSLSGTVTTKETRSSTPGQTSPAMSTTTGTVLASNANRLGATIYNEGSATVYMKLGATASITSYTCQIASGGYYEVPFNYTGVIDGITASGTATLRVTEIT